jgi:hypothetical protein
VSDVTATHATPQFVKGKKASQRRQIIGVWGKATIVGDRKRTAAAEKGWFIRCDRLVSTGGHMEKPPVSLMRQRHYLDQ